MSDLYDTGRDEGLLLPFRPTIRPVEAVHAAPHKPDACPRIELACWKLEAEDAA